MLQETTSMTKDTSGGLILAVLLICGAIIILISIMVYRGVHHRLRDRRKQKAAVEAHDSVHSTDPHGRDTKSIVTSASTVKKEPHFGFMNQSPDMMCISAKDISIEDRSHVVLEKTQCRPSDQHRRYHDKPRVSDSTLNSFSSERENEWRTSEGTLHSDTSEQENISEERYTMEEWRISDSTLDSYSSDAGPNQERRSMEKWRISNSTLDSYSSEREKCSMDEWRTSEGTLHSDTSEQENISERKCSMEDYRISNSTLDSYSSELERTSEEKSHDYEWRPTEATINLPRISSDDERKTDDQSEGYNTFEWKISDSGQERSTEHHIPLTENNLSLSRAFDTNEGRRSEDDFSEILERESIITDDHTSATVSSLALSDRHSIDDLEEWM